MEALRLAIDDALRNAENGSFRTVVLEGACIEVADGSHLIWDLGSRNKTRRDKVAYFLD